MTKSSLIVSVGCVTIEVRNGKAPNNKMSQLFLEGTASLLSGLYSTSNQKVWEEAASLMGFVAHELEETTNDAIRTLSIL